MNLCEKSGVLINKYGIFYSLRKTMFFAEVKKDLFSPPRRGGAEGEGKTGFIRPNPFFNSA